MRETECFLISTETDSKRGKEQKGEMQLGRDIEREGETDNDGMNWTNGMNFLYTVGFQTIPVTNYVSLWSVQVGNGTRPSESLDFFQRPFLDKVTH